VSKQGRVRRRVPGHSSRRYSECIVRAQMAASRGLRPWCAGSERTGLWACGYGGILRAEEHSGGFRSDQRDTGCDERSSRPRTSSSRRGPAGRDRARVEVRCSGRDCSLHGIGGREMTRWDAAEAPTRFCVDADVQVVAHIPAGRLGMLIWGVRIRCDAVGHWLRALQ
jgi:hypothetical protein